MKWMLSMLVAASVACDDYEKCAEPTPEQAHSLPIRLVELTALDAGAPVGDDVLAYEPNAALYSDGASKRRWMRLPPGSSIDTSDPDAWRFPQGTAFWKEFAFDGAPAETRLLLKTGPGDADWAAMAYVWKDGVATAAPDGAALGAHDVPSSAQCFGCHGGRASRVLGFSAVQLPATTLAAIGPRLSSPPVSAFALQGTAVERSALQYLHANCSHCHNGSRPDGDGPRCYDPEKSFSFSLHASDTTPSTTDTYRTAVGHEFRGGDPDGSKALKHFLGESSPSMPPLGTRHVDPAGASLLREWVLGLPN